MKKGKRNFKNKLLAGLAGFAMLIQCSFGGTSVVKAAEIGTSTESYIVDYNGSYTPESIFTDYQLFAKGDLAVGSHTVGAYATGGDMTQCSTFGEAQYVPTYVNNVKAINIFQGGTSWYANGNSNFYYSTATIDMTNAIANNGGKFAINNNFIDFDVAFESLETCANNYVTTATAVSVSNGAISIPISKTGEKNYVINYADFQAVSTINLKVDGMNTAHDAAKVLSENKHVISITGVNASDVDMSSSFFGKLQLNGTALGSLFKELAKNDTANAAGGEQAYYGGLKLIWNFPDATGNVSVANLSGHLLAPKANVSLGGGNYEGGVIANTIATNAEGHFYPFGQRGAYSGSIPENPVKPSTADATFSKKAVSADGAELAGAR